MRLKVILVSVLLFISVLQTNASNFAGGDITYQCVGQDSFLVAVNIFTDCSGASWTASSVTIDISGPCTGTLNKTLQTTNSLDPNNNPVPVEVSQLCQASLSQSTCNGGSLPGRELFSYEGLVVLPVMCNSWTFSYTDTCCRNNQNIQNLANASSGFHIFTTLNNQVKRCNSSPEFDLNATELYMCAGQQVCHYPGVLKTDNDSLGYSLVSAYTTSGVQASYKAGYTYNQPIQSTSGISLDPATGKIQFTPIAAGNYLVTMEVCEYDKLTGSLIGCVRKEWQYVVDNCSNASNTLCMADSLVFNPPFPSVSFEKICVGEYGAFSVVVTDQNVNDVLTATSDIAQVLPGATMSMTPSSGGNPLTVTFSWAAIPIQPSQRQFNLTVKDDHCPIEARSSITLNVEVIKGTSAGNDRTICQGSQQAQLNATGGDVFTWSVLQGDPNSLSCSNCQDPVASPNVTTDYMVVSNLGTACKNADTVRVTPVPDFGLNITGDSLICSAGSVQLNAVPDQPFNYSYQWSNGQWLNDAGIASPIAEPRTSTKFTVTVSSGSGCVKTADVNVDVSPPFPRNNRVMATDTIVCLQDTVQLAAELGSVEPATCGASQNICVGDTATVQVGNGTFQNNPTSSPGGAEGFPTPFAGEYNSAKQQYLYRAADLKNAGMEGGVISAISFFVVSNNGPVVYSDFTVRIGCTGKAGLKTTWEDGLTQVVNPQPVSPPVSGWKKLNFDVPYDWDGQSNLIVELHFNNPSGSQSAVTRYRNVSYNAASFFGSSGNAAASIMQHPLSPVQKLPNIRFGICSGIDSNVISYNWFNAPGLSAGSLTSGKSIEAGVDTTMNGTFQVAITDTFGYCFDTLTRQIHITSKYDVTPDSAGPFCTTSPLHFMRVFTPADITHPGGRWSGPGIIDDSLGVFNPGPSGAGLGTHWIKYAITGDACANADSIAVDVITPPDAGIVTQPFYCENDAAVLVQGVNPGFVSGANQFFQKAVKDSSGLLDLSKLQPGLDSIQIKWTAHNQACSNDSVHLIRLTPQFDPDIVNPGSLCPGDTAIRLTTADSASLQAGQFHAKWLGTGILDQDEGWFDPSVYTPGAEAMVVLDSSGLCGSKDTVIIQIDTLPEIAFHFPLGDEGPFCKGKSQYVTFEGSPGHDPGVTGTGNWNHLNNWLPGTVNAFNLGNNSPSVGTYQSVYAFTDMHGCKNWDTLAIDILPDPPEPSITHDQSSNQLVADNLKGDYKWFLNGSLLGQYPATKTSIPVNKSGLYYVEVTNACATGTSDTVYVELLSTGQERGGQSIVVYPNPIFTSNDLFIESGEVQNIQGVKLTDVTGREIGCSWTKTGRQVQIQIGDGLRGVYFITAETTDARYNRKILILD